MRPQIICHIASSVDGRLINERWTAPYDGSSQGEVLAQYVAAGKQLGTDAWMFGLNTARGFLPDTYVEEAPAATGIREPYRSAKASERWFIVSDPSGSIRYDRGTVRGDNIIAILSRKVSDAYLSHLRDMNISYVFAGDDGLQVDEALANLYATFGIRSISLQGGGIINGAFLAAGLVDELSLVIYPGIDGLSGVPSIFEYLGKPGMKPAAGQTLELKSAERLDKGVVWLRYTFHHPISS